MTIRYPRGVPASTVKEWGKVPLADRRKVAKRLADAGRAEVRKDKP